MESATKVESKVSDDGGKNARSTIAFPYGDLDGCIEVAKGVHNAGGNACEVDQLAAQLQMEAKGGGFRTRITGAQTFNLVAYERGRVSLTPLGMEILDPTTERKARMNAFLKVPLYEKVFEEFKGRALPPQAGLERAIITMGVGAKVADRARQALMRSAKQAGFFEQAPDRLIKPIIKDSGGPPPPPPPDETSQNKGGTPNQMKDDQHPLIAGLLVTLPAPGKEWPMADRANWLNMANSIFNAIYKMASNGTDNNVTITVGSKTTGNQ